LKHHQRLAGVVSLTLFRDGTPPGRLDLETRRGRTVTKGHTKAGKGAGMRGSVGKGSRVRKEVVSPMEPGKVTRGY